MSEKSQSSGYLKIRRFSLQKQEKLYSEIGKFSLDEARKYLEDRYGIEISKQSLGRWRSNWKRHIRWQILAHPEINFKAHLQAAQAEIAAAVERAKQEDTEASRFFLRQIELIDKISHPEKYGLEWKEVKRLCAQERKELKEIIKQAGLSRRRKSPLNKVDNS